jgi:exopolyphosphatase/guanosine-5'-triphosphate,3'-diphosphate pyrophosphatase
VKRLAAIDLGSNTIRLLVADADPAAGLTPVHAEQVVARLGEGLARSGVLGPGGMARAAAAVRAYRDRAAAMGAQRVIVVATAAVRDARNGGDLVRALEAEGGLEVRVADGAEEARLALLGVAAGMASSRAPFCLVDVGGGSTELVVARGAAPLAAVSLDVGVVRLAERFFGADPPRDAEYDACVAHVVARLAAEAWPVVRPAAPERLVGTAGTATTLAALDLGLSAYDARRVQGHRLDVDRIEALRRGLSRLSLAERARLPCLEPGRADLIIPGIAVVLAVLRGIGFDHLTVSDTGLREGILLGEVGWAPAMS